MVGVECQGLGLWICVVVCGYGEGYKSMFMVYGSWFMVYGYGEGFMFMVYGLWFMVFGYGTSNGFTIAQNLPQTLQNLVQVEYVSYGLDWSCFHMRLNLGGLAGDAREGRGQAVGGGRRIRGAMTLNAETHSV